MTSPLSPVPRPEISNSKGQLTPPWQAWFTQLYTYLSSPTAGGGGVVPTTRTVSTTLPLTGGGSLASNLTLSLPSVNAIPVGNTTPSTGVFTTLGATGSVTGSTLGATGSVTGSASAGAVYYGSLGYSDVQIIASWATTVNGYNQMVLQNTNAGASASTNFNVSNNLATMSTFYGEFGINSSGFTGTGAFSQASAVYLAAASSDLVIGTYASNPIHFVVNSGATDAMTIATTGAVTTSASIAAGTTIKTATYLVATLPAATPPTAGARAYVTDALAPSFSAAVTGGGAVPVPVYSDGTSWRVG